LKSKLKSLPAEDAQGNFHPVGYLTVRRLLFIGRLAEAERTLAEFDPTPLPPALRAARELGVAGIAMRRLQTKTVSAALTRAGQPRASRVFLR